MRYRLIILSMMAVLLSGFYSCKKANNTNNTSYVKMHLTDDATLYDAVYLDVQQVTVQMQDSSWTTLSVIKPGIYNIITLRNGMDTLIVNSTLPAGHIAQIRLILGSNNSVVVSGTSYPLTTPSAQESGLKLNLDQTLVAGISYDMWIDFDANSSIHQTGSGNYMLKPVIRGFTAATNGEIEGTISPVSLNVLIQASDGVNTYTTIPDLSGHFMFTGLPAGTYQLTLTSILSGKVTTVNNVNVKYGNITMLGTITITL